MLVRNIKNIPLENQNWLQIVREVCAFEISGTAIVLDCEFEHIKDVTIKGPANHKIVWSLLLVVADHEQAAVVLCSNAFNQTSIIHRRKVMTTLHQQLRHL